VALLAGAVGASLALLVARTGGALTIDGVRTVTVAETQGEPPAATVADLPATGFDARRIYRERTAGVVTVTATIGANIVSGSGFVVSTKGLLLTNAHVVTTSPDARTAADVKRARRVYVRFADGNSLPATIVGYDLFDDIAVLRVDPRREHLVALTFGRTASLRVGDPLAVIGSPFGKDQAESLSIGVVSALGREIQAPAVSFSTPNAIQTDAAINHGNSGGPVFDARGRVVGVAAQIESTGGGGEGVGFAIPVEAAKRSLSEILRHGTVRYAWLGVSTEPVTRELARQFRLAVTSGLLVDGVSSGGPAERAGLSAGRRTAAFQDNGTVHPDGDVIVRFAGRTIRSSTDLSVAVAAYSPGAVIRLDLVRAGRPVSVDVTLGQRPTNL
jgi:S1-C subfamily serine protease